MTIKILSFGFKHGAPVGTTRIIDCRDMRNPHKLAQLRELNGKDRPVAEYVEKDPKFDDKLSAAMQGAKDGEVIGFGCFGGRHRSVAMAEFAARYLRLDQFDVTVEHVQLAKEGVL